MNSKPPKLFDRLLDWYCGEEGLEDLQSDIYEVFFERCKTSKLRANGLFPFDVLNLFNPFSSQRRRSFWNDNPTCLFLIWNYLTVGVRNLKKNKIYVLINTFGLGISLACCITTYLWVAYDSEFDDFHKDEKVSEIYKLHSYWDAPPPTQNIFAPYALGPLAAQEIAGIERFTRYNCESGFIHFQKRGFTADFAFADSTFFEMFDFTRLNGDLGAFKKEQFTVISQSLAEKLFGDSNPIGKAITLKLSYRDPVQLLVGAVIDNIPQNSSFTFECMIRVEILQKIKGFEKNDWSIWPAYSTFFELSNADYLENANKQFQRYLELCKGGKRTKFKLEHFKADFTMTEIVGAWVNVRMYSMPLRVLVGLTIMIFMIACFNLANTSFALIAGRLKEIGIRKSLGAKKSQIFAQFLVETCVIVALSLLIGMAIAQYIVPAFADMWAQGISNRLSTLIFRMEDVGGLNFFITLILIVFACAAIAGIYPAIISSKYDPVNLLKGSQRVFGTNGITRFLLVIQFSISILVLTSGIIFIKNSNYIATKDLGFDSDRLIFIRFEDVKQFDALSNSIKQIAGVSKVAASQDHFGIRFRREEVDVDGKAIKSKLIFTGSDYFETMGFSLIGGRYLNESDFDKSVVITKGLADQLEFENPTSGSLVWRDKRYSIVGVIDDVVENWYAVSAREKPQVFFLAEKEKNNKFLIVRTEEQSTQEVYKQIVTSWDELYPFNPINANIHIKQIQEGPLDTAKDLSNVFIFLTIMTALLSLTGVYSLAALNVEKRKNEIGIRKTLGASISHLTQLLNKEFLLILGSSAVIGSALCFLIFHEIMTVHDYNIIFSNIGLEPFVIAPVLLIIIGGLTSGGLIFKAASTNPTSILRNE